MALKNRDNPDLIRDELAHWLPSVLDTPGPVEVSDLHIPSSSGLSAETVLFDCAWTHQGQDSSQGFVIRISPGDSGLFPHYDLGRELQVMSQLRANTRAPIPAVRAHENTGDVIGAPFALLDRVYGEVPGDDPPFVTGSWVTELTAQQRATMYDEALKTIAEIQTADPATLGLTDLAREDLGDTVIDQELQYWRRFYHWSAGERRSPTIDTAYEILTDTRPPNDQPLVVSWGDARFGNLMFGPDQRVTGVFDWEMACLGRPEVDLGYFLFFDRLYSTGMELPRLDGFPNRATTITRFEELTGHPVRDLDWYEAWAALRGAIIMMRLASYMIELGMLPQDNTMALNNPPAQVLAALLNLPAPDGDPTWITGHRD